MENPFNIQDELKKLPDKPGVYLMKDDLDITIYVGKAINLKNRVRQYFQASGNHSPKVLAMVERIQRFEYIVTDSELEALILECNLIKKFRPKFNILLKDDKTYPYIKVTLNEEYPRVLMTRRILKDGAKYFGPYTNIAAVHETIHVLKKLFPIKSCNRVLPRDIGKSRPCLNFYIHQCLGPCQGDVNKEDYRNVMKDICSFLAGHEDEIIKKLNKQMIFAAETLDFEKAAIYRDKLTSLRHITEKQKVLSTTLQDQDVIGFAKESADACIQVFFIRGGKLIGREHFIFEGINEVENGELLTSFAKQFYATSEYVPVEIIMQEKILDIQLIEKWLTEKRTARVHIIVPQKGDKKQLIDMVSQNAMLALTQFKEKMKTEGKVAKEGIEGIVALLGLQKYPKRIEAYDISNTGTSEIVGSMVVFEDGNASNKQYRRFKIKSQSQQNDYGSMQEVLFRRFRHADREFEALLENGMDIENNSKFAKLPDLILVDGGKGHVNAARKVLMEHGKTIPVFGMVKDNKHRTRGLAGEDFELELGQNLPVLRFVTSIQDEAHRFAIEYNKLLRSKRYKTSSLDEIEGIGTSRKKALIKHFGSVGKIKQASIDDIEAVEGISRNLAEKIYDYFK